MIFRAKLFLHFKNSYSFDILISQINFKKYKNIILNKKKYFKTNNYRNNKQPLSHMVWQVQGLL